MQTALALGAVHCEIPKTTRARCVARLMLARGGDKVAEWVKRQFCHVVPSPSFGHSHSSSLRYATHTPRMVGGQELDEIITRHLSETREENPQMSE